MIGHLTTFEICAVAGLVSLSFVFAACWHERCRPQLPHVEQPRHVSEIRRGALFDQDAVA